MLCRNKIRPWCLVQWQLLKKRCQRKNRTHVHFRYQIVLAVYVMFRKLCRLLRRVFQILCSLETVFPHLTISEPPFTPPTNVGSDGDMVLLLTFCQNDSLVLSACSAAARPLALCILTSLQHCRSECLKSFFV